MSNEMFLGSNGFESLSQRKSEVSRFIKNFEEDVLREKPEILPLENIFVESLDYAIDYGDQADNVLTGFSKEKISLVGERVSGYFRTNHIIRSRLDEDSKKYLVDQPTQKIVATLSFGLKEGRYYFPSFLENTSLPDAAKITKTVRSSDLWRDTYRVLQDTDLAEHLRGPNMPIDDWKEKNDIPKSKKEHIQTGNIFSLEEVIMNGEYKEVTLLSEWDNGKIEKLLDYISDSREDWEGIVPPDVYYSMCFAVNGIIPGTLPSIKYEDLNQQTIVGTLLTVETTLSHLQERINKLKSHGKNMSDISSLKDLYDLAIQLENQSEA